MKPPTTATSQQPSKNDPAKQPPQPGLSKSGSLPTQSPTFEIPPELAHIFTPYLKQELYPHIAKAVLSLCEKMVDDGEVRKYNEKTREQEVLDQEEKRHIESKMLREQLGDQYTPSSDDEEEDRVKNTKVKQEKVEAPAETDHKPSMSNHNEEGNSEQDQEGRHDMVDVTGVSSSNLGGDDFEIEEERAPVETVLENIKEEEEAENQEIKIERYTYDPFRKIGPTAFNPLFYLGTELKKMAAQMRKERPAAIIAIGDGGKGLGSRNSTPDNGQAISPIAKVNKDHVTIDDDSDSLNN